METDVAANLGFNSPSFWVGVATRSQVTIYTTMASWIWLVWDWISTFDDEVNFVWATKWTLSKFLYIATRYFGIFLLTVEAASEWSAWDKPFCHFYYSLTGIGSVLSLFLVEIGMQFRVYALYDGSKRILYINGAIFIAEAIVLSTLLGIDEAQHLNIISPPYPLTGCWNTTRPQLLLPTWFIALAYETYLFCLVGYKAWVRWQEEGRLMGMFRLMFRDALMWFFVITALLAWNAFAFLNAGSGYIFLGLPFFHAASAIGGSRLVIDIRKAYDNGDHNSMVYVARPTHAAAKIQVQRRGITKLSAKSAAAGKTVQVHRIDSDWTLSSPNDDGVEEYALREIRNMQVTNPTRSFGDRLGAVTAAFSTRPRSPEPPAVAVQHVTFQNVDGAYFELKRPDDFVGSV